MKHLILSSVGKSINGTIFIIQEVGGSISLVRENRCKLTVLLKIIKLAPSLKGFSFGMVLKREAPIESRILRDEMNPSKLKIKPSQKDETKNVSSKEDKMFNIKRLLILCLLVITFLPAQICPQRDSWRTFREDATFPNQGRRLLRNPSNNYLHLIFDAPAEPANNLGYTYSSDGGNSWAPLEHFWTSFFDGYASLSLDGNTPWSAWISLRGDLQNLTDVICGGVRIGENNWTKEVIWSPRYGFIAEIYPGTSTVISPSGGTNPMAYTVFTWEEWQIGYPYNIQTGWMYLDFVAWELDETGTPRQVRTSRIESIYLGPGYSYNMEASIAVSSHRRGVEALLVDTIHICYKYREGNRDRIFYRKNVNEVHPSKIRNGILPIWSERIPVSTPSDPIITEPASQPSIEYYGTPFTANGIVTIVWRGPNQFGQNIGEIYRRYREIGNPLWWGPIANVSQSPNRESSHPEGSTGRWAVVYEEQVSETNWETYLNIDGAIFNMSNTSTPSRYPHCAVPGFMAHLVWTEDKTGYPNDWVQYLGNPFVPWFSGGQSSGKTELPSRLSLFKISPNPISKNTIINYHLQEPTRLKLQIYSVNGELVRTLRDEFQNSGSYSVYWDGRDNAGKMLPNGIYLSRLSIDGKSITKPLSIIR